MSLPSSNRLTQFIKLLTEDASVTIGDSLNSETSKVAAHSYMHTQDVRITLIDTPGFDDSRDGVSDVDILQQITKFLGTSKSAAPCHIDYTPNLCLRKLNGLLYLHRISDPRVGKVARRNLRMFKSLCGDKALKHSAIVTTFWSSISERDGLRREQELCADETLFKPFLDNGAQVMRHDSELESAKKIMEHVAGLSQVVLQVQTELSHGTALKDTLAGQVLLEHLKELREKHKKEIEDLKAEMKDAAKKKDKKLKAELAEERKKMAASMTKNQEDINELELKAKSLWTSILAIFK
jgi:hypothetical protein